MTYEEINAHLCALHNICRFNGHVKRFYSVAEHTAIGLECMMRDGVGLDEQRAFAIHDLPEAVLGLGDLARDVKREPNVAEVVTPREINATAKICDALDVPFKLVWIGEVRQHYDRLMAVAEVEAVALCDHDNPGDYDPWVHGFAARRIREGSLAQHNRPTLYPHFERLFGGTWG
jgi:hypothetical protein